MLLTIAFMLALTTTSHDLIDTVINTYENIESYQVTLRTSSNNSAEEIKYYFKKPGYVRMEFIKPHKGAVLVYNPFKQKARLMPFGFLRFFVLTLDPGNRLIKSSTGHRVDESDIGALLKMVKRLQTQGNAVTLKDETVGNRQTVHVRVEGEGDFNVDGIHKYLLWLDKETLMPLKVSVYNTQGKFIEELIMDDLQINIEFPGDFFDL
jgi:outer membrane lipoprotein-sorting protein